MALLETISSLFVHAIAQGLVLALLGLGITLVFGLGEVLNLALGMFAVLAVTGTLALTGNGVGLAPALVLGLAGVGLFALVVDRTVLSFVYRLEGEDRILLGIFTTLGLAFLIEGVLFNYFPFKFSLPVDFPLIDIAGLQIPGATLVVIVLASVVLLGLFVFLTRTYFGNAIRTIFHDEIGAQMVGIEPRRMRLVIFVLSSLIAGIAGLLHALTTSLTVASGFELTVFALIVSILGGIRNVVGVVLAGLGLSIVQTYANFFIGAYVANIILFSAVVLALFVKSEEAI